MGDSSAVKIFSSFQVFFSEEDKWDDGHLQEEELQEDENSSHDLFSLFY